MKKTNIFIVGAQKCGTTTLADFLKIHPQIALIKGKEPHLFSSYYPGENKIDDAVDNLYKNRDGNVFIDASTSYSFPANNELSARRIFKYNPDAKFIFIVKEPITRIISHYNHRLRRNRAVQEIDIELKTNKDYLDHSCFYASIMPFIKLFGQDKVLILSFEKFLKETPRIAGRLEDFLELEHPLELTMPNSNRNVGQATVVMQYAAFKKRYLRYLPERFQIFIRNKFFKKSIPKKEQPSEETVAFLKKELEAEMARFYDLTGIDYRRE